MIAPEDPAAAQTPLPSQADAVGLWKDSAPLPAVQEEQSMSPDIKDAVDIERASASSANSFGDMAGAGQDHHYQPGKDIITRLEHLGEKDMKVTHPFSPIHGPSTAFLLVLPSSQSLLQSIGFCLARVIYSAWY